MKIFSLLLIFYMFNLSLLHGRPPSTCPSSDSLSVLELNVQQVPSCGDGYWIEVANINTTDSSRSCPSPWTEVSSPSRLCTSSSCFNGGSGAMFTVPIPYTRVCGRALGVTTGFPDAFLPSELSGATINETYSDGLSVTYGSPRNHIWTLAVGHSATDAPFPRCPCANSDRSEAPLPPPFVGENYFCASVSRLAENVWDGINCSGPCCQFNSPPWFSTTLPASTSDSIEVRICRDEEASDEAIFIQELQIFVQ